MQNMSDFVELHSAVIDLGVHGHTFCSAWKLKTWYNPLVWGVGEVVNLKEVPQFEESATQTTTVFKLDAKVLHYVTAPGIYRSETQINLLLPMFVAQFAVYFRQNGLPVSEMLRFVNYMGVQDVVGARTGFTNVVTNVHVFQLLTHFMETSCLRMIEEGWCNLNRKLAFCEMTLRGEFRSLGS